MTSTDSRLNTSRVPAAMSRRPSTKVLDWASAPRMKGWSPVGLPPSPLPKVMPGVAFSASCRLVAPLCLINSSLITWTVLGVSSSGAVNLAEGAVSTLRDGVALSCTVTVDRVASWAKADAPTTHKPVAKASWVSSQCSPALLYGFVALDMGISR